MKHPLFLLAHLPLVVLLACSSSSSNPSTTDGGTNPGEDANAPDTSVMQPPVDGAVPVDGASPAQDSSTPDDTGPLPDSPVMCGKRGDACATGGDCCSGYCIKATYTCN